MPINATTSALPNRRGGVIRRGMHYRRGVAGMQVPNSQQSINVTF